MTGSRLDNFLVGLTNIRPSSTTDMDYTLCGQWPGSAPDGQTMFVTCQVDSQTTAFRYVTIRGFQAYLNFCELEVYASGELPVCFILLRTVK
jgi:hypothetical protein